MKILSFCFFLLTPMSYADTLTVNTQYGRSVYVGDITQLDTEDLIKQVEINNAVVSYTSFDLIFENDFEYHNPNWVWNGEDTHNVEFGGVGQCAANISHNQKDVTLWCHQIINVVNING